MPARQRRWRSPPHPTTGSAAPQTDYAVTVAKVAVGRAVEPVTTIAHQLHGAIGVTREHQLWLATMRARSWVDDFGSTVHYARRLGRMTLAADDPWDVRRSIIPENQFKANRPSWEIRDVKPGETYVLKVQAATTRSISASGVTTRGPSGTRGMFTVPLPPDDRGRTLAKVPVGDGTSTHLEKQIDLPDFNAPTLPSASVAADVDVYNAKTSPMRRQVSDPARRP